METGIVMARWSALITIIVMVLMLMEGTFLPSQMGKIALPGIGNGSLWANLVLMSATLYLIGPYTEHWTAQDVAVGLILGMVVSWLLFFFVYQNGKYDDGLSHPLSLAGVLFFIYGGAVYAAIGLFYLRSNVEWRDVVLVGVLLALYIPIANHAMLGWVNSWGYFEWSSQYPRIFDEESSPTYFIGGGMTLMALLTGAKLLSRGPWIPWW